MSFQINLKSAPVKPEDYAGDTPNASNPNKKEDSGEAPAFAGIKLKSTSRPADYDGSVPNVGTKKTEESSGGFNVNLKKAEGGRLD